MLEIMLNLRTDLVLESYEGQPLVEEKSVVIVSSRYTKNTILTLYRLEMEPSVKYGAINITHFYTPPEKV